MIGLRKNGVSTLKRGKIARSEGVELPDGEIMKEVEQEGLHILRGGTQNIHILRRKSDISS